MKEQIEEKVIEEMAFDLCLIDRCKHLPQEECNNTTCAHCEAEALYNAGYRKQKEGEWEEKSEDRDEFYEYCYKCSVCGHWAIIADEGDSHYCPNCGAKMKGEENEKI